MVLTADCQRRSDAFHDRGDACPNCGWGPETWRRGGRDGLRRPRLGGRD